MRKRNLSFLLLFCTGLWANEDPSTSPEILLREAFRAEIEGRDAQAIDLFREYLQKGKDSAHTRLELAKSLFRTGKVHEALTEAEKAQTILPDDTDPVLLRAELLRKDKKLNEALAVLSQAHEKFPNDANVEFLLAETLFDLGRLKESQVKYLRVAIALEGRSGAEEVYHSIALWRLVDIYFRQGEMDHSKTYLIRYIQHNPDRLYARFLLGYRFYFNEWNLEKAREELEPIAQYPEAFLKEQDIPLGELYYGLGQIYFIQGNPEAKRTLLLAKRFANGPDTLLEGLLAILQNNTRVALNYIPVFLKKYPTHLTGRIALLQILERTGPEKSYVAELLAVSQLAAKVGQYPYGLSLGLVALDEKTKDHTHKITFYDIYRLLSLHAEGDNQYRRAILYGNLSIQSLEEINASELGVDETRKANEVTRLRIRQSQLLSSRVIGDFPQAHRIIADLLTIHPKEGRVYAALGAVYSRERKYKEASEAFSQAIELKDPDPMNYFLRAAAFREQDRFEETESDLKHLLKQYPDFAAGNNFLGYLYAERGIQLQEGLRLIQKAVDTEPNSGAFQDSLGWVLFQQGDVKRAIYHLELASMILEQQDSEDPVVLDHLGDAFAKAGFARKANNVYKRATVLLKRWREKKNPELDGPEYQGMEEKIEIKLRALSGQTEIRDPALNK